MKQTISVFSVIPFAVLAVAAAGAYADDAQASFSIHISAPDSAVEAGTNVRIRVLLTNTSTRIIGLFVSKSPDALFNEYQAHVYDATDRHCKMSKLAWRLLGMKPAADDKNDYSDYKDDIGWVGGGGYGPVHPGETRQTWLDLAEAYAPLAPGTYTVWVSRVDPNTNVLVKSNTLTLTITSPTK